MNPSEHTSTSSKKVLVFGTFDNLHPGHLFFLKKAATYGDLSVAVALDQTVEHIKKKRPQQSQEERVEAIAKVFPDAHVSLGDAKDYLKPIRNIEPDLIVLGYDQNLPPGVSEEDFSCPTKRLESHEPEKYKTSLRNNS